MSLAKVIRPIHTIVTHTWAHLDEMEAVYLAQRYGKYCYPGIDRAQIKFWDGRGTPDGRPASEWEKEGHFLIAVDGCEINEHLAEGGRQKNTCAASILAKKIGINTLPELKGLLDYTIQTDQTPTQTPWSLPTLIKDVNQLYDGQPAEVFKWVNLALDAIINGNKVHKLNQNEYFSILNAAPTVDLAVAEFLCRHHDYYFGVNVPWVKGYISSFLETKKPPRDAANWLVQTYQSTLGLNNPPKNACIVISKALQLRNRPELEFVLKYAVNPSAFMEELSGLERCFEFSRVLSNMHLLFDQKPGPVLDWAMAAIASKIYGSQRFQQAGEWYRGNAVIKQVNQELSVSSILDDNTKVLSYWLSRDARQRGIHTSILVQRKTDGHTCLYGDKANVPESVMEAINGELVSLEVKAGGTEISWYYFKEANHIYNGSLSAPNVPPTRLSLDQIVAVAIKHLEAAKKTHSLGGAIQQALGELATKRTQLDPPPATKLGAALKDALQTGSGDTSNLAN